MRFKREGKKGAFLRWLYAHPRLVRIEIENRSLDPERIAPDSRIRFVAHGSNRSMVTNSITYADMTDLVNEGAMVDVTSPLAPGAAPYLEGAKGPVRVRDASRPRRRGATRPPEAPYDGRDL